MAGYNRIIIVGNLTRDPELKQVGSQSVCKFGIASNRQYKNRQTGMLTQEVCFIDVDVWGIQAESCKNYLQKGRMILVEGRLKFDSWKDQEGNTRNRHSIMAERVVFLSAMDQNQNADLSGTDETHDSITPAKESALPLGNSRQKKSAEVSFKDQPPFEEDLPF